MCGMLLHSYYTIDPRVQRAAHALRDTGWHVKVICLNRGTESSREVVDGVEVIRCNMGRSKKRARLNYVLEYASFMLRSFFRLIQEDFRLKHDLVIVHNMPNALVFSALPVRLRGCPVVLDLHDSAPEVFSVLFGAKSRLIGAIVRFEESLAMRFASSLITVNRGVERVFIRRNPWAKFLLIHNSPSTKQVSPTRDYSERVANELRIVFHGNLHERFGLQRLVRLLPELISNGPNITLDVHGDGPYRHELEALVKDMELVDRVSFHGAFNPDELTGILAGKHLGVALHYPDDLGDLLLPVKILEYAQAGVPIVASRLATVQAYFSEDCIAYFDSSSDLFNAVMNAHTDYEAARKRADLALRCAEEISWERDAQRLVDHVDSLCHTV